MTASGLRIAHVHWTAHPTTGGVESHLHDVSRQLAGLGASVTILTGEPAPEPVSGVEIVTIPDLDLRTVRDHQELRGSDAIRLYERVLGPVLRARRPQVVHGHNLHHFSPAPALALDRLRTSMGFRLFQTFHETWPDVLADNPVYAGWDGTFAVSEHVLGQCRLLLGFEPELLRLCVDVDRFRATAPRRAPTLRILHPARVLPWKGVHLTVEMMGALAARGIDAELTITDTRRIADWKHELESYRTEVVELARALDLLARIHFTAASFADMPALYAASDIVVYPTVGEEPYGLVPLEAMSSGRPIVASRSGGITETVVDGVTGFLVDRGDVGALAECVDRLARNPALRRRMGVAGRRRVEEAFDSRHYVAAMVERYTASRHPGAAVSV
jgi:glycosyltransferase involved in cell wall biosynthesis